MTKRKLQHITNLLVTGPPGVGKTTLVQKVLESLKDIRWKGFFTREIREGSKRTGFEIITHNGKKGILAHVNISSGPKVGRYRVNLRDIADIAVPAIIPSRDDIFIIIDEIGTMEMHSSAFREALFHVLDAPVVVFGTVKEHGDYTIEKIKKRPDVYLLRITPQNRNEMVQECLTILQRYLHEI